MPEYAILIVIPLIFITAFFLRSYLLLKYKWVGKDSFYHFIVAQEIRKNKSLPKVINRFIVPEKYSYPPLLHLVLSFFPEKYHSVAQYLGPISDIGCGVTIFFFCSYVLSLKIAIMATALYLFTPMTIDDSFSFAPRSFANWFMVISLLSLFHYLLYGSVATFIGSIIFATLVLLTHRLTTQSLIFVILAFFIAFRLFAPLWIIALAVLLAVTFTKGYYLRVISGHIDFLKVFGKKVLNRASRKEMPSLFPNPVFLLFNMPIFIILPIFFFHYNNASLGFFIIWGSSLTVLSFIYILGEGIRHMRNAIPAFSIVTVLSLVNSQNYIILFIFMGLSLIFSIYKIHRIEKLSELGNITSPEMIKGFNYIKSHQRKNDVLLCLPLDITYTAAYFTDCIMLQSSGGFAKGLDFNQKLHKKIREGKINELIKKYNVRWVLAVGLNKYSIKGKIVFRSGDTKVIIR